MLTPESDFVMNDQGNIKYRFFIDRNGNWFQDGIKVQHKLTYLYNNKLLDIDDNGEFFIDEGSGKLYVEVEDTPFVVKMVDKRGESYFMLLNDRTEEKLEMSELELNEDNIPYTSVKDGKFRARFARPAYYELMKHIKKDNGSYYIESDGSKFEIGKA